MPGAISVSTSSHLPAKCPFHVDEAGDIPARTGQARNEASADRVGDARKYDRDRPRRLLKRGGRRSRGCEDHIRLEINQLFREHPQPVNVAAGPTNLHPHVAAIGPTQFRKPLHKTGKEGLYLRIAFVPRHEHADPPQPAAAAAPARHRPCRHQTAEQRNQLTALQLTELHSLPLAWVTG